MTKPKVLKDSSIIAILARFDSGHSIDGIAAFVGHRRRRVEEVLERYGRIAINEPHEDDLVQDGKPECWRGPYYGPETTPADTYANAEARAAIERTVAQSRREARVDTVGHDSVQPWSAGPLFPCVIATVERYRDYTPFEEFRHWQKVYGWSDAETRRNYEGCRDTWYTLRPLSERLESVSYVLFAYGRQEEYATREDAEQVARALNESPRLRARWAERSESRMDACVLGTIADVDQRARDAGAL
jgi:hypothetical protein